MRVQFSTRGHIYFATSNRYFRDNAEITLKEFYRAFSKRLRTLSSEQSSG